jgi:DNA-binding NarL/FixJ family response regulator
VIAARLRALVVEDDRSWQEILSENLSDVGLEVDAADSLEMALSFLKSQPHRIAVVDLSLRGQDPHNQDGLRVLEAVRRLDPGCVTMLVTGFATVELAVSALTEYGAFTCLRKEAFQRSQFRELIHSALATAPGHGEELAESARPRGGAEVFRAAEVEKQAGLVLVVEDDAGWRGILSELLLDAGLQVRVCGSYGEALGYMRREKYSLAVIDLSLSSVDWAAMSPVQDLEGYRLIASTRAAGIPTVVVSGVANPADIERTYGEYGIFAFMEKQSFDRRAFRRIVDEARRVPHSSSELDTLTDREREVLDLLALGMTNKEIADRLFISTNTVKRHIKAIFGKLDIHTRSAAARKAASTEA